MSHRRTRRRREPPLRVLTAAVWTSWNGRKRAAVFQCRTATRAEDVMATDHLDPAVARET